MERPILFSGEMVRAILEGCKTQTRRVVKRNLSGRIQLHGRQWHIDDPNAVLGCPYGQPGDRLWVRETWAAPHKFDGHAPRFIPPGTRFYYRATEGSPNGLLWRPSIHMPRWASRITLEVTNIKLERVQEISWQDALDEGVEPYSLAPGGDKQWYRVAGFTGHPSPIRAFRALWDSINDGRGYAWAANPWVWVLSFKRVEVPV